MFVVFVSVTLKPGQTDAFLRATKANHEGSLGEPGCERFDVLRDLDDESRYYLYEVYRDKDAAAAHKETAHYKAWAEAAEPLMAKARTRVMTESVYPDPWK